MKKKEGFLLIESVFELFLISITMLIVFSTFVGTFYVLKDSLEEMVNLNLLSNAIMEIMIVAKNEMQNVTYTSNTSDAFSSLKILGDCLEGGRVGFSFDALTHKLLRHRVTSNTIGDTLISQKITAFSYDGKFIRVALNEECSLKLFIEDLR
ncbi:MAG TPA: type II secretion system protein [Defluviitoga sp.]|nr:type II secretion system protein [Defluviitoga sp.]HOP24202.1 type II secretion system protein [Defluviitoga sp.]HPZ28206.1 type II secretion system protein [Defluviitoga sp.]HQD62096.1 type II secretion system protein [Defluviitoga sp.]